MTFERLPSAIERLGARISKEVNESTQKVAVVILETAAANTPVDTTQALSNWQVGLGSGPKGFVGPKVPGKFGSTKPASLSITVREGKAVLKRRRMGYAGRSYSRVRDTRMRFPDIHIVNNASYINGLNDGTISRQPSAFVQKAILAGNNQLAATRLDLRDGI